MFDVTLSRDEKLLAKKQSEVLWNNRFSHSSLLPTEIGANLQVYIILACVCVHAVVFDQLSSQSPTYVTVDALQLVLV